MRRMFSLKQLQEIADARVESLVESGNLDNAKPIYCHPISIGVQDVDYACYLTMLIFNNDAEPFNFATFNRWLDNLVTAITNVRIMTSGFLDLGGTMYPTTMLYANASYRNVVVRSGLFTGGAIEKSFDPTTWKALNPIYFNDGVNKIN